MKNSKKVSGPLQWFLVKTDTGFHLSNECINGTWSDDTFTFTDIEGRIYSSNVVQAVTSPILIQDLNRGLEIALALQVMKELYAYSIPFSWDMFDIKYKIDDMAFRASVAKDGGIPVLQVWYANVCTFSTSSTSVYSSYFTDLYKNLSK